MSKKIKHLPMAALFVFASVACAEQENYAQPSVMDKGSSPVSFGDKSFGTSDDVGLTADVRDRIVVDPEGQSFDHGFFEPENRVVVDSEDMVKFPQRVIAYIAFESVSGVPSPCTGFFVSESAVLTAGHCLHSGLSESGWLSGHEIFPGLRNGQSIGTCEVVSMHVHGKYVELKDEKSRNYDVGVVEVKCDHEQNIGWFGISEVTLKKGDTVSLQGYMHDDKMPRFQQIRSPGEINEIVGSTAFYENDSAPGSSGSPVYLTGESGAVIGVHVSGIVGDTEPWSNHNHFIAFTDEIVGTNSKWISNIR